MSRSNQIFASSSVKCDEPKLFPLTSVVVAKPDKTAENSAALACPGQETRFQIALQSGLAKGSWALCATQLHQARVPL